MLFFSFRRVCNIEKEIIYLQSINKITTIKFYFAYRQKHYFYKNKNIISNETFKRRER